MSLFGNGRLYLWIQVLLCIVVFDCSPNAIVMMVDAKPNQKPKQKKEEKKEDAALVPVDHVSMTSESAEMRSQMLRKKKRKGLLRKETDLSSILFPKSIPEDYQLDQVIPMYSELVESKKTQVPYHYYKVPGVCPNVDTKKHKEKKQRKNLGQLLMGYSTDVLPFEIRPNQEQKYTELCKVSMTAKEIMWLRKLVERKYRYFFTLDSLPILMRSKEMNFAVRGFPIGFIAPPSVTQLPDNEIFLFNHFRFTISFSRENSQNENSIRITGFDVHPISYQKNDNEKIAKKNLASDPKHFLALRSGKAGEDLEVTYSYEVIWQLSSVKWADRWDVYLISAPDDKIQYVAILNSLMMILLLTGGVATILARTIKQHINMYNETFTDDTQEESGWKLLHGDVFRAPAYRSIFTVAVGTGVQIGSVIFLTLLGAILHLFNPLKKGQTLQFIVVLYVLTGSIGGYVCARLYKFLEGKAWQKNSLFMASAFPGILVGMFSILNIFLGMKGAATSVSIWMLLVVYLMWVCVSAPLAFIGSYFGFIAPKLKAPTKVHRIARFIPSPTPTNELSIHHSLILRFLVAGIFPAASIFVEAYFIMGALWLHQMFYVFGLLVIVMVILTATCTLVNIGMTYFHLCAEDHKWWWKSWMYGASVGFYCFLYSLWFLYSRLQLIGILPVVVYITYMSIISFAMAVYCGSVGVLSSFLFIRTIYGAVKFD